MAIREISARGKTPDKRKKLKSEPASTACLSVAIPGQVLIVPDPSHMSGFARGPARLVGRSPKALHWNVNAMLGEDSRASEVSRNLCEVALNCRPVVLFHFRCAQRNAPGEGPQGIWWNKGRTEPRLRRSGVSGARPQGPMPANRGQKGRGTQALARMARLRAPEGYGRCSGRGQWSFRLPKRSRAVRRA